MNIIKVLFQIFLIYMLYKFVFHFVIPVFKTTRQMKAKMNEMNARMQEQQRQQQNQAPHTTVTEAAPKPVKKDYIDFEEIKE